MSRGSLKEVMLTGREEREGVLMDLPTPRPVVEGRVQLGAGSYRGCKAEDGIGIIRGGE